MHEDEPRMTQHEIDQPQSEQTLSRRSITRMLAGGAFAVIGGLLVPKSAEAGISWCRTDPLITVNGKTGHVYVDSTADMYTSRSGPVEIEVQVPAGAIATAVPLDNAFGLGYTISFREARDLAWRGSYTEVRVAAFAPAADDSLPVRVYFHSDVNPNWDSTKTSVANQWIRTGAVRI